MQIFYSDDILRGLPLGNAYDMHVGLDRCLATNHGVLDFCLEVSHNTPEATINIV